MLTILFQVVLPSLILYPTLACQAQADTGQGELILINDQLTNVDPVDPQTNNHHKVHVVTLQAAKTYQISLIRKDGTQNLNPYLRIEDAAGKELMAQSNSRRVRFQLTPPSNASYRLITAGGIGEYLLKITPAVPIQVLKDHDPAKTIDVDKAGFELTNRLTAKDPRDKVRQQMFAKVFLVRMLNDRTYSIFMQSGFDSYLRLEDAAGKGLAEDDDSGGNLNALIVFRAPQTGVYRVIATSYRPDTQGEFMLRVEED